VLQVTLCFSKQLLQTILQDALVCNENFLEKSFSCMSNSHLCLLRSKFQHSKSLLKRIHKTTQLTYLSAVPHQICAYADTSATKVAHSLAAHLSTYRYDRPSFHSPIGLSPALLNHLHIQATPSGYLEFKIDDWAIAHWLNHLTQPVASVFGFSTPQFPTNECSRQNLFSIQHAHARCCSLLRLAVHQQRIGIHLLDAPSQWQWTQPDPISWLTTAHRLRTWHLSERQLINQCFTVLDELPWQLDNSHQNTSASSLSPSQIMTLAQDLAQAFSTMHQQCQIWGVLQTEGRDRLTAHLALILVTQRLLYGLLQIGLGVVAPEDL